MVRSEFNWITGRLVDWNRTCLKILCSLDNLHYLWATPAYTIQRLSSKRNSWIGKVFSSMRETKIVLLRRGAANDMGRTRLNSSGSWIQVWLTDILKSNPIIPLQNSWRVWSGCAVFLQFWWSVKWCIIGFTRQKNLLCTFITLFFCNPNCDRCLSSSIRASLMPLEHIFFNREIS